MLMCLSAVSSSLSRLSLFLTLSRNKVVILKKSVKSAGGTQNTVQCFRVIVDIAAAGMLGVLVTCVALWFRSRRPRRALTYK